MRWAVTVILLLCLVHQTQGGCGGQTYADVVAMAAPILTVPENAAQTGNIVDYVLDNGEKGGDGCCKDNDFVCEVDAASEVPASASPFAISTGGGNNWKIAFNGGGMTFDYEVATEYTFEIKVTEGGTEVTGTRPILTIAITDVNEIHTVADASAASASIPENTVGTAVTLYTWACTDVEVPSECGGDIAITVESVTPALAGVFTIDSSTGTAPVLKYTSTASTFDFESVASYAVKLRAKDADFDVSSALTVTITDVNEAPTLTVPVAATLYPIDEDVTAAGTVLTLAWTDPDSAAGDEAAVYSIVTDPSGKFSVNAATGAITYAANPGFDYEALAVPHTYELIVKVTDSHIAGGLTFTATATVEIIDKNETPVWVNVPATTNPTVAEDVAGQADVYTLTATDPDASTTLTYALVSADTGPFVVVGDKLRYDTTISTFNYEVKNTYDVIVSVSDGTLTVQATLRVEITDVNDAPVLTAPGTGTVINEDVTAADNAYFTFVTADEDTSQTHTYTIAVGPVYNTAFYVSGNVLKYDPARVTSGPAFDYERTNEQSYTITVTVTDSGSPAKTDTGTLTVPIGNINEPPTWNSHTTTFELLETVSTTQDIIELTCTDPENDPIIGLVTLITPGTDSFGITHDLSTVGTVKTKLFSDPIQASQSPMFDFETAPEYRVTVVCQDAVTATLKDTTIITINIKDVNESPIITFPSNTIITNIREDAKGNVNILNMLSSDPEGATITYAYSITPSDPGFSLSATGTLKLNAGATGVLNYEAISSYNIVVDVGDGTNIVSRTIIVNVVNVNEGPVGPEMTVGIREDNSQSLSVVQLNAADPENSVVTYMLKSISPSITGAFAVSTTGEVTVDGNYKFDYETIALYTMIVKASDATGVSTDLTVTVNIVPVNEPPIIYNLPWTTTISETVNTQLDLYDVVALDPEDGADVDYYMESSPADGSHLFAILHTGKLVTLNNVIFSYWKQPQYILRIMVADRGSPPTTATGTVTVRITYVPTTTTTTTTTVATTTTTATATYTGILPEWAKIALAVVAGCLFIAGILLCVGVYIKHRNQALLDQFYRHKELDGGRVHPGYYS